VTDIYTLRNPFRGRRASRGTCFLKVQRNVIPTPDPAVRLAAGILLYLLTLVSSGVLAQGGARGSNSTAAIVFVGDVMLDEHPGKLIEGGRDPFAPFAEIMHSADFQIGNLECVVATTGMPINKIYTFRAHPRTLKVLKRHFTALSLANNHTGDFGSEAFVEMLDLLKREGLPYFGGGRNLSEAHAPLLLSQNGLKIALLGYDEFLPRSFEAGFNSPGVAWSEDEQVRADIANAKTEFGADVVIPFMHWGWENQTTPSQRQRKLAQLMIDAGADAVVGAHPHVMQGIEFYKGRPIFYSLGNFVFNGFAEKVNNTGWLLRLELDKQGIQRWKIYIAEIDGNGVPHPSAKNGYCFERGRGKEISCSTKP
jgi:poly-gamma-glutamate capsule biosynthesis protein CapA/YwtB (metallophosphatase superfamily)